MIVGVSVLIAAALLYFGINYLKGINILKAANYYYATYTNVEGLAVSAPVTLNGFQVGQVRDVVYQYDNPGHVTVELGLDRQLRVPVGSKAVLTSSLLGSPSIVLEFAASADCLPVGAEMEAANAPSLLDGAGNLLPAVGSVVGKVDSLLTSVNRLVGDSALLASVRRLDAITANLQATAANLNRTVAALPATLATVDGVAANIDSITADLAVVSEELKQLPLRSTMDNVDRTMANIGDVAEKLNRTDNSVGLLLNDRSLYDHLNSTATGLDSIMWDLKKNPRRYIPPIKIF